MYLSLCVLVHSLFVNIWAMTYPGNATFVCILFGTVWQNCSRMKLWEYSFCVVFFYNAADHGTGPLTLFVLRNLLSWEWLRCCDEIQNNRQEAQRSTIEHKTDTPKWSAWLHKVSSPFWSLVCLNKESINDEWSSHGHSSFVCVTLEREEPLNPPVMTNKS